MKNQNPDNSNSSKEPPSESSSLSEEPPPFWLVANFSPEHIFLWDGASVYSCIVHCEAHNPKMIFYRIKSNLAGCFDVFETVITGRKS